MEKWGRFLFENTTWHAFYMCYGCLAGIEAILSTEYVTNGAPDRVGLFIEKGSAASAGIFGAVHGDIGLLNSGFRI
jgi:hypothetical protein